VCVEACWQGFVIPCEMPAIPDVPDVLRNHSDPAGVLCKWISDMPLSSAGVLVLLRLLFGHALSFCPSDEGLFEEITVLFGDFVHQGPGGSC